MNKAAGDTRYWKRSADDGIIYFATATNAAHARAESDTQAEEISSEEYEANVPKEVHNGADRQATQTQEKQDNSIQAKTAAFAELQEWSNRYSHVCTVQDQISMLALWQHQLCNWAMTAMQQGHRGGNNVQ